MKRNLIVYSRCDGVQAQAVRHLTEILLDACGEQPACISADRYEENAAFRPFFIGVRSEHPYLQRLPGPAPAGEEAYRILVRDDAVFIEGSDGAGVLYGCVDFYARFLTKACLTHDQRYFASPFESSLPDFELTSAPAARRRGLWTWGHVVYDFRGYIDNMVRLKLNTLIIWNDFVPVNAREMVEYAHACNVRIYWGYPWGWDTACLEVDVHNIFSITDRIIAHYTENYAHLGGDGVYFQSFTETHEEKIGGKLIAEAVTEFVNHTAERMLEAHPGLDLLFGLHASSVRNHLDIMRRTDPRLTILWEDCGAFPYDYIPSKVAGFEGTLAFTREIIALRGEEERFGTVLKGFTSLDWSRFVHQHGSFLTGSASPDFIRRKAEGKADIWRFVQAFWLRNADCADKVIRLMNSLSHGRAMITSLVEDGLFERSIPYPVALYAAMCWGYEGELKDLMCDTALNRFIRFA